MSACSSGGKQRPVVDSALDLGSLDTGSLEHWGVDQVADKALPSDGGMPNDVMPPSDGMLSDRNAELDVSTDGAPPTDATTDAESGSMCRPECVEKVFGACSAPKTGSCVNTGKVICYSNGVKMATMLLDGGTGEPFAKVTLFKPDGTMCGWYTNSVGSDGNVYLVYYDANGVEVARQERVVPDASAGDLRFTCNGQSFTITSEQLQSPACQRVQAHDCPMGMCS